MTQPTNILDLVNDALNLDGPNGGDPGPKTESTPSRAQTGNAPSPWYTVHDAAEALEPQPPIDWIVENLFSAGSVSLVVGEGGSKKTWSMLDLAVCVATGNKWLNFVTKQAPVLLIDEESGPHRLARRLGDVMRGHEAAANTPIRFICMAGFNYLKEQKHLDALQWEILCNRAGLVVVDALADVMIGGDENAVKDVQPVFHGLRAVADATGAAIVVIHHANKGGGYRGSSAMHGAVDLMLMVDSEPESSDTDFKCEKARDVEPHRFTATAHFEDDLFCLTPAIYDPAKERDKFNEAELYVFDYLTKKGDSRNKDIAQSTDLFSINKIRNAVNSLMKKNEVERKDSGSSGAEAVYGLKKAKLLSVSGRK